MALQRQLELFPFLIMLIISIIPCSTGSLHADPSFDYGNLGEYGYDFEAYPSAYNYMTSSSMEEDNNDHGEGSVLASAKTIFSVDDFGAKGDGSSDDTQAFVKAWSNACSSETAALLLVPKKTYLVKPITFLGPCKLGLTVQIYGTIEASDDRADYNKDGKHWLLFSGVQNLVIQGLGVRSLGTINGNGKIWWQNSCKINTTLPCKDAPTALTFYGCNNVTANHLRIQNGQQIHVSFENCVNVNASNLHVTAPKESPNTDGIHVTNTQNIHISSCHIGTGDDCISIVSGSQEVRATDINCGPGHGISIGSLGKGKSEAHVSDVVVNGANLYGTTNGVRIKTWQGGSGSASNITFQNVEMYNVSNPIIIDQNYCDQKTPCPPQKSAVQVKDVTYQNIRGTSASDVALAFNCNESFPCQGIVLQDIDIKAQGGRAAKALCNNVETSIVGLGVVSPRCP